MKKRILAGFLCVVLAASSVAPLEMRVFADEAQTEETAENTRGGVFSGGNF